MLLLSCRRSATAATRWCPILLRQLQRHVGASCGLAAQLVSVEFVRSICMDQHGSVATCAVVAIVAMSILWPSWHDHFALFVCCPLAKAYGMVSLLHRSDARARNAATETYRIGNGPRMGKCCGLSAMAFCLARRRREWSCTPFWIRVFLHSRIERPNQYYFLGVPLLCHDAVSFCVQRLSSFAQHKMRILWPI